MTTANDNRKSKRHLFVSIERRFDCDIVPKYRHSRDLQSWYKVMDCFIIRSIQSSKILKYQENIFFYTQLQSAENSLIEGVGLDPTIATFGAFN